MINEGKEWTEFQEKIQLDGYLKLKEQSPAPGTPAANYLNIYAKDKAGVSALYLKDDAGNEREIAPPNTVTSTGVNGRVAFWTGTNTLSSDTNLFWDNVNKRFGVGISASLLAPLH